MTRRNDSTSLISLLAGYVAGDYNGRLSGRAIVRNQKLAARDEPTTEIDEL